MAGAAKGFAAQEHGASALWDWHRTLERIHEAPLSRHVRRLDARRAQRRRLSTRKTPRPLKKGRCARPAGLRRGQEGHGPQAPHRRRHDWSPARRERSARRHSRSRAICCSRRVGTRYGSAGGCRTSRLLTTATTTGAAAAFLRTCGLPFGSLAIRGRPRGRNRDGGYFRSGCWSGGRLRRLLHLRLLASEQGQRQTMTPWECARAAAP